MLLRIPTVQRTAVWQALPVLSCNNNVVITEVLIVPLHRSPDRYLDLLDRPSRDVGTRKGQLGLFTVFREAKLNLSALLQLS